MIKHLLECTLALLSVSAPAAGAGTLFVDVAQTGGANDGSSWANAFQGPGGLQAALAVAVPGDQVWVAQGTYLPSTTLNRLESFRFESGVEVYGGFDGTETALAERDFVGNPTTLSGDLLGDDASGGSNAENSYHVLRSDDSDETGLFDGFTITAGHANGSLFQDSGAGLMCRGSPNEPTVRNCRFVGNEAVYGGGAGYLSEGAAPTFEDCLFQSNHGGSFGGGFLVLNSVKSVFRRCVFERNRAVWGGGIHIDANSPVELSECLITGNMAAGTISLGAGGGILISDSNPQIRNCTLVGNRAIHAPQAGIQDTGGMPTIANCVVALNTGNAGSSSVHSQISPANLNVTWTLSNVVYGGTGNVTATPSFEDCGPHPFALAAGSAGVDAGSNAAVAAGSTIDLAGAPRFFDVAGAPNTGLGISPLVDMGAYETGFDCNGNGVSDTCDIALGTSFDVDGDGLPDECACVAGTPPTVYCTAKLNSQGCVPSISSSGVASASSGLPFPIRASSVLNQTVGILFYGHTPAAIPFQGGTLCINGELKRTPGQSSGGSATGSDCTGSFSFDFNAFIATGSDPLLQLPTQPVHVQFFSHDPAASFGSSLTDALQFSICM